jgi:Zn-dependent peptidase ImmA (M78 family)/DNA-binding XRE family transcriptional regulator
MNQAELGRRLREARELCGRSQQEAAEAIDAPRTAITQIEAGNREVSTLELSRLAKLYRVNVTQFFFEEEKTEGISVILHRAECGFDEDPVIKKKIERCLELCRKGREIEKLVRGEAERLPPFYRLSSPRNTGEAVAQAEQVAEQERRRLGIETMPIVDMTELLATQGVWVAGSDLPSTVSGLFWHHSSVGLAILVNAEHARARRRFSYAHEYGHALMDRERLEPLNVSSADNASEIIEKRANAFAAAFLMPKVGVSDFLQAMDKGQPSKWEQSIFDVATESRIDTQWRSSPGSQTITYKDAASLAHYFGVSYQAAVYRLRSLSFISQKECTELLEQEDFGRSYLRLLGMDIDLEGKDDPSDPKMHKRELRSQIINLAIEAYRRESFSRGQLLDLGDDLELDEDEKEILLELANCAKAG